MAEHLAQRCSIRTKYSQRTNYFYDCHNKIENVDFFQGNNSKREEKNRGLLVRIHRLTPWSLFMKDFCQSS